MSSDLSFHKVFLVVYICFIMNSCISLVLLTKKIKQFVLLEVQGRWSDL